MSSGLYGSLFSGVSGLTAQSTAMGVISDNIANVNTVGYKGKTTNFLSLVTNTAASSLYSPGGVRASVQNLIDQQGLVQSSSSPLDVAISGNGFFVVNSRVQESGDILYTRAGSFVPDSNGFLKNPAGYYLQGWPLDPNGRLPGEPGNVLNTTSFADISSLEAINVAQINGTAAATTDIDVGINLDSGEGVYRGAEATSLATTGIGANTDLVASGVITAGDTVTLNDGSTTFTYTQGADFTTLQELADEINTSDEFAAEISGNATASTITVYATNPRRDLTVSGTAGDGAADLAFNGAVVNTYDKTDPTKNMASGAVNADFSRSVRVFDAQGEGHDIFLSFLKVGTNEWAVETFAADPAEVNVTSPAVNGQLATGTIDFNGDGTLNSISTSLSDNLVIDWANGASDSEIAIDWGTAGPVGVGLNDGLGQIAGGYNVANLVGNGAEAGELNGISIDEDGVVIASFSNGQQKQLYQLPVATFASAQNLAEKNGNVFAKTDESGDFNLRQAGRGGAGVISPQSLELSNVDMASEFTDMITTQRAYSASSKIITTVDDMLQELLNTQR